MRSQSRCGDALAPSVSGSSLGISRLNSTDVGIDGSVRTPGNLQTDGIAAHQHETLIGFLGDNGTGTLRNIGNYGGGGRHSLNSDLTFDNANATTETRPLNVGIYKLIRI